jgi:hypothetical protein
MRHRRCAVTALLAVAVSFALGGTAMAFPETEAGLLYLSGESGAMTFDGTGLTATFVGAAATIKCSSTAIVGTSFQSLNHVVSGRGAVTLYNCKETKGESKFACNTEGAPKEVVDFAFIFTFVNALTKVSGELQPGVGITVIAPNEKEVLKVRCGPVSLVEITGTSLGSVTEVSLTADGTTGHLHFVKEGIRCDTENSFCKKSQEKHNELLGNFTGVLEKLTLEADIGITFNKMMIVDD